MREEYYYYDYWKERYDKETIISLSKQGLGYIGFEQYVVLFFTEEFPEHGNFFHKDFDTYLTKESVKCDYKLKRVLADGIQQTLEQVMSLYKDGLSRKNIFH